MRHIVTQFVRSVVCLCVCVLHVTRVSCAKTPRLIDMPFWVWTRVGLRFGTSVGWVGSGKCGFFCVLGWVEIRLMMTFFGATGGMNSYIFIVILPITSSHELLVNRK